MSMSSIPSSSQSGKLYGWVERIGNKVPHPFLLFIYLIIVLMVTTAILSAFGVSAKNPTDGTPVVVKNLLSVEGLHWFLPNVIKNFSGFAPLGAILALVLGAGLAERVGLLPALMVKMASHVNTRYASYMVLFIAFFSHISSDAALVIMPPMGAIIFLAVGRHPVAGLLAAIAGVGCGFTANLLIVTTDVLLSGISTDAAAAFNPQMHVSVIDNWYFMASSVVVLTIVGGLITDKIIEPRLGQWQGNSDEKLQTLTESQRFGLRIAGVVSLLFMAAIALMVIPENGILRDPINHTVMPSPFIKGIVPLIILFFFVVSLAYGIATRTIRHQADLPHLMIEPMKEIAGFIVMVFPLAQFVAMFNWSNMGKFIAVGLTDILESSGLSGIPAFVGLALLSSFLMHVYRQRFRNLVDSGPHFRTDVYATWLSPGICANPLSYCRLIRIAFSASISFCSTVSWIPATLQTRRETGYLLFVSFALSTYLFGGMAADVAGVVSCRSADRSGDLPTFVLRENGC